LCTDGGLSSREGVAPPPRAAMPPAAAARAAPKMAVGARVELAVRLACGGAPRGSGRVLGAHGAA
jgi:hypothetical protein